MPASYANPDLRKRNLRDPELGERMVRAYCYDGMTLQQIGTRHGISRERVRQYIVATDNTLYRLERMRRAARSRLERFVRDTKMTEVAHCRLCGEPFEVKDGRTAFCDNFHNKVWSTYFRFHVDEDFHEKQRFLVTRKETNHYQNLLDGTAKTVGRWLVFGSTTWHWAVRAYYCRWPVFDEFPEQIRQQIIEHEGPLRSETEAS